ncbi:uncharacterized protein LOC119643007 [Glossina fuscipes]|uniref:Uncharacterized protein LOC119643007 n=1 Tax=Glossina fuscipes TaxID=7396 RepID=A0A9C6E074_9MUSC|nr:uncharacterized protein LOC119643007 [Glossina fuscipes]
MFIKLESGCFCDNKSSTDVSLDHLCACVNINVCMNVHFTVLNPRALHAPSEYETEVKCRLYSDDSVDFNTHLYKSDELNLMKTMYDHFNKVGSTLNNIKISLAEVVAGTKLSPKRA